MSIFGSKLDKNGHKIGRIRGNSNFARLGSVSKNFCTKIFNCEFFIFFIIYPVGIGLALSGACGGGICGLVLRWRRKVNGRVT